MKLVTLLLTCVNNEEADKISHSLLKKKLVVCIKKSNASSSFLWKGKINQADEVLLIMESVENKFEEIGKEIRKIHSYSTFVLLVNPVVNSSKGVEEWMEVELNS